jgi:hypothetical protein
MFTHAKVDYVFRIDEVICCLPHVRADYVFRIDEVICCLPHVRADYVFHMMRLSVVYLTPELIMCSA